MNMLSRRSFVCGFAGSASLIVSSNGHSQISLRPKRAHIVVALADNSYQGIVPVPKSLGNGQDPDKNLYWGAMYGVKSYFHRHKDWNRIDSTSATDKHILDYCTFKRSVRPIEKATTAPVTMVAEAWDGQHISKALKRFYKLLADVDGDAGLVGFVGHNTLMDKFTPAPIATAGLRASNMARERKAIILACKSAPYFSEVLNSIGVSPALMTKGLMAPEAYSLEAALSAWARNRSMKLSAAQSYAKYQKIPQRNANWLFGVR